jgi:hypothetical protein
MFQQATMPHCQSLIRLPKRIEEASLVRHIEERCSIKRRHEFMNGPKLKTVASTNNLATDLLPLPPRYPYKGPSINIPAIINRTPQDVHELERFLHNRLGIAGATLRRKQSFIGRIYNLMTAEDPDYIQMSGARLKEVLPVAGYPVPDDIRPGTEYALRRDIVEAAHSSLQGELNRSPLAES